MHSLILKIIILFFIIKLKKEMRLLMGEWSLLCYLVTTPLLRQKASCSRKLKIIFFTKKQYLFTLDCTGNNTA